MSKRTGKPGYAPACRNEFVRGVCKLPKVKCGECPNQAFLPIDDAAVLAHPTGRHVMGVYPLLEDDTCWFLAVAFDKGSWTEDVRAFVETCARVAPRRSEPARSAGDGAPSMSAGQQRKCRPIYPCASDIESGAVWRRFISAQHVARHVVVTDQPAESLGF